MNNLIEQNRKAKEKIEKICRKAKTQQDILEKQEEKELDEIRDQMTALENKKYDVKETYQKQRTSIQEERQVNIAPHVAISKRYDRVLKLLKWSRTMERNIKTLTPATERMRNQKPEDVATLGEVFSNDYLKVMAFIYNNGKPKNKYSLVIAGDSFFPCDWVGLSQWYGSNLHFKESFIVPSIMVHVKDSWSKEELIKFFKGKNLDDYWCKAKFEELIKEYETVLKECNTPEWEQELLAAKKE